MNVKAFYIYRNLTDARQTISIKSIDYQKPYEFKDLFFEIADSTDEKDLLSRLKGIIKGKIALEKCKGRKISYRILSEKVGSIILRIELKQETTYGTL